jgi:hypothetical protein
MLTLISVVTILPLAAVDSASAMPQTEPDDNRGPSLPHRRTSV